MARCLVGCGSNVGKRRDFLDRALELLRFMPGVRLVGVSRFRDTRPIGGPVGQQAFLNGACLLETDLGPHDVMGMLAAVENTLHRERDERWGPRTVDLDLLLYDDLVLDTADLTVPHPRMATRRFVLEPCVEIAPDLVHPRAACTLSDLLESISMPHPYVAVIGVPGSGAPEVAAAVADVTLARLVHAPAEYARAGGLTTESDLAASPEEAWRRAVEACARPLLAAKWPDDPHGTVADYWLPALRLAAADELGAEPYSRFDSFFARVARDTVSPHVAIMLVASPEALEERLAFLSRGQSSRSDVFADLMPAAAGSPRRSSGAAEIDGAVARLLRLQERIAAALCGPRDRDAASPRAVVTVAADDLGQAVQEAVAAVEAMA
jgi:2-amino-4-hydroxy-6-hydroxymethyldihydropteridine diphosphokinase